jgi:hypothetical protein
MHRYAQDLPKLQWVEFTARRFMMHLIRVIDAVPPDFGLACAALKGGAARPLPALHDTRKRGAI